MSEWPMEMFLDYVLPLLEGVTCLNAAERIKSISEDGGLGDDEQRMLADAVLYQIFAAMGEYQIAEAHQKVTGRCVKSWGEILETGDTEEVENGRWDSNGIADA